MARRLLERDQELATLLDAAREAADGTGSVVLLHGEAGIGKTSLVSAIRSQLPADTRMLVGSCDALSSLVRSGRSATSHPPSAPAWPKPCRQVNAT